MWLLNTHTLRLHHFTSHEDCQFAILSHRWYADHEEVTFEDLDREPWKEPRMMHRPSTIQNLTLRDLRRLNLRVDYEDKVQARETKAGWKKVLGACNQAKKDGYQFLWVDSCCINKTSSSELSEAINSMYQWYGGSQVCYAYLSDVTEVLEHGKLRNREGDFQNSSWFERGWTLQELIAPPSVTFFNAAWQELGTRAALKFEISLVTDIPDAVLGGVSPSKYSVAQRMSWAAKRQTKRGEDQSYSLMGLFDINMPLLYGEGKSRAFQRLQYEIIRTTTDQTIFAWEYHDPDAYHGLLADSLDQFAKCQNLFTASADGNLISSQISNLGVEISLPLRQYDLNVYQAILACEDHGPDYARGYGGHRSTVTLILGFPENLPVGRLPVLGRRLIYGDDRAYLNTSDTNQLAETRLVVVPNLPFPEIRPKNLHFGFTIGRMAVRLQEKVLSLSNGGIDVIIPPSATWSQSGRRLTLAPGSHGTALCFVAFLGTACQRVIAKLGLDDDFTPWAWFDDLSIEAKDMWAYPQSGIRTRELAMDPDTPKLIRDQSLLKFDTFKSRSNTHLVADYLPEEWWKAIPTVFGKIDMLQPYLYRANRQHGRTVSHSDHYLNIALDSSTDSLPSWTVSMEIYAEDVPVADLAPEVAA